MDYKRWDCSSNDFGELTLLRALPTYIVKQTFIVVRHATLGKEVINGVYICHLELWRFVVYV